MPSQYRGLFAASRNGRVLYVVESGLSGNLSVDRFDLRVSSCGSVYGVPSGVSPPLGVANASEITDQWGGSRAFVSYLSDPFIRSFRFDGSVLCEGTKFGFTVPPEVLGVGISPRNIEVDPYGRFATALGGLDFRLHAADEALVQQSTVFGARVQDPSTAGTLRISSDGLRAISFGFLLDLVP